MQAVSNLYELYKSYGQSTRHEKVIQAASFLIWLLWQAKVHHGRSMAQHAQCSIIFVSDSWINVTSEYCSVTLQYLLGEMKKSEVAHLLLDAAIIHSDKCQLMKLTSFHSLFLCCMSHCLICL